jgi:ABC-2 type transport system ATP-binding protein
VSYLESLFISPQWKTPGVVVKETIIETQNLTVYYGKHRGIIDVNLSVEKGEVFGYLGPNGAGKTTTQRVLMDEIRPTRGRATIFGRDCQKDGVAIRKHTGYLPGELSLYPNMKGRAFLRMLASLHETAVDRTYRQQLYDRLDLDPTRKMKEYSRGNKQKIGVIAAFMGQPDLLILDEPTSGLDPLVQQTVMELMREAKAEGRTVFLSSHILPEVQAVCDRVGIIRNGEVVRTERVETLTAQQFKRVHLTLRQAPPAGAFALPGVTETSREGKTVMLEIRQNLDEVLAAALLFGIEDLQTLPVTLEEIFLAFYDRQNNRSRHD